LEEAKCKIGEYKKREGTRTEREEADQTRPRAEKKGEESTVLSL
jgi:hypothetical protein